MTMRSLLVLALALVFAACDGTSDGDLRPDVQPRFEATVTGAVTARLEGSATARTDLSGTGISVEIEDRGSVSVFVFEDADSESSILLFGSTDAPLAPGRYPIQSFTPGERGRTVDGFAGAFLGSSGEEPTFALSTEGTVEIESVSESQVVGTFSFRAASLSFDGGGRLDDETVEVTGAFVVDLVDPEVAGA